MFKSLKEILIIAKKDLLEFSRDRLRLFSFVIMPIFMMLMVGFIFPNENVLKNISLGITNKDQGEVGEKFIKLLTDLKLNGETKAFQISFYEDENQLKEALRQQKISGGLIIKKAFSQEIRENRPTELVVLQDQSNPQIATMLTQVISQVIAGFNQQLAGQKILQIIEKVPGASSHVLAFLVPVQTKVEGLVADKTNYFEFMAPGIMAMIIMTAVLTGLASSVAREKEQGTLDGLLISPVSRLAIILGKALSQAIRGLIQGIIVLLLAIFLFGVKIHGSLLLVAGLIIFSIFSFVGLGILVSAIAAEQETATQLLFMFQFPMLFFSGVFFPIQQMPSLMQKISRLIPLSYAIEALRKVMILGAGLGDVKKEIFVLLVMSIISLSFAVPLFKRLVTR